MWVYLRNFELKTFQECLQDWQTLCTWHRADVPRGQVQTTRRRPYFDLTSYLGNNRHLVEGRKALTRGRGYSLPSVCGNVFELQILFVSQALTTTALEKLQTAEWIYLSNTCCPVSIPPQRTAHPSTHLTASRRDSKQLCL
jgi:hypothetical protein